MENKRFPLEDSDFAQTEDAIAGVREKALEVGCDDCIPNKIRLEAFFA